MTETRISLKAKAQSIALISIAILGFTLLLLAAVDHAYVGATGSENLPVALLVSGAALLGASIIGALGMAFARLSARKN
jgi:hypothetical protein